MACYAAVLPPCKGRVLKQGETLRVKACRAEQNPLITPADVKPHHEGFEVIGAFNAGIARHNGEVLMLLRVAERPVSPYPGIVLAPVYKPEKGAVDLVELKRDDPRYDFSDPRIVRDVTAGSGFAYLTSLSYIRIARSPDGRRFTVDDKPFVYPSRELETFGIEDPRVTKIGDTFYVCFSAAERFRSGRRRAGSRCTTGRPRRTGTAWGRCCSIRATRRR